MIVEGFYAQWSRIELGRAFWHIPNDRDFTCRDMPIRTSSEAAYAAVLAAETHEGVLIAFWAHFLPAGADIVAAEPAGWRPGSEVFNMVQHAETQALACRLHDLWPSLVRKVRSSCHPPHSWMLSQESRRNRVTT